MPIRNLLRGAPADGGGTGDTALAFAFDSGYLRAFRAMVASMACHRCCLDSPVYIISDDPDVFRDPFVLRIMDHAVPIEGELRHTLYDLAMNSVRRRDREDWNRGTFLKWAIFRDIPEKQLLFLDVDMICLQNIDALLSAQPDAEFLASAQLLDRIRHDDEDKKVTKHVFTERVTEVLDLDFRHHPRRINSGMMLVRKRFLSVEFFREIVDFARRKKETNEQSHITRYFDDNKGYFSMVPILFNFQESFFASMTKEAKDELGERIFILHYAGKAKPWKYAAEDKIRPSLKLWHTYDQEVGNLLTAV